MIGLHWGVSSGQPFSWDIFRHPVVIAPEKHSDMFMRFNSNSHLAILLLSQINFQSSRCLLPQKTSRCLCNLIIAIWWPTVRYMNPPKYDIYPFFINELLFFPQLTSCKHFVCRYKNWDLSKCGHCILIITRKEYIQSYVCIQ